MCCSPSCKPSPRISKRYITIFHSVQSVWIHLQLAFKHLGAAVCDFFYACNLLVPVLGQIGEASKGKKCCSTVYERFSWQGFSRAGNVYSRPWLWIFWVRIKYNLHRGYQTSTDQHSYWSCTTQKLVQLTAEHPEYRKNYCFPSYQEVPALLCLCYSTNDD